MKCGWLMLDLSPGACASAARPKIIRGREACKSFVSSEELARARVRRWRARSRSCRRWARCTPGIWRWSPRRSSGRTRSRPRSSSIRPSSAPNEDLGRYPRREEEDVAHARGRGLRSALGAVRRRHLSARLCDDGQRRPACPSAGKARRGPGHFDGVATVVAKLLLSVRPDVALFGEKDFQQLAVIRRMVADLNLAVEIVGVPTVREPTASLCPRATPILSAEERSTRVALPRALQAARAPSSSGDAGRGSASRGASSAASTRGFSRIDYFALVDAATLEPLDAPGGAMRLIAAAVDRDHSPDRQSRRLNHG